MDFEFRKRLGSTSRGIMMSWWEKLKVKALSKAEIRLLTPGCLSPTAKSVL